MIALLQQPTGATLKTIMAATGWQPHSVPGFISGEIGNKLGLRLKSFQRDGERVYCIVSNSPIAGPHYAPSNNSIAMTRFAISRPYNDVN